MVCTFTGLAGLCTSLMHIQEYLLMARSYKKWTLSLAKINSIKT